MFARVSRGHSQGSRGHMFELDLLFFILDDSIPEGGLINLLGVIGMGNSVSLVWFLMTLRKFFRKGLSPVC